jgi:hypothetical protein
MKKIVFIPADDFVKDHLNAPKPARKYVPDWYKHAESYISGDKLHVENFGTNLGIKSCVSYLDAFIHGYTVELWTDLHVSKTEDGNSKISWTNTPEPVMTRHPGLGASIPRPAGYDDSMFNWVLQWGVKLPKGYSLLMTHPLNRTDLPFTTLTGIVDSDVYVGEGKVPFFIQKDFEGIIPAGTPIMQLIPIKRNRWIHLVASKKLMKFRDHQQWSLRTNFYGFYKKNYRQPKDFD